MPRVGVLLDGRLAESRGCPGILRPAADQANRVEVWDPSRSRREPESLADMKSIRLQDKMRLGVRSRREHGPAALAKQFKRRPRRSRGTQDPEVDHLNPITIDGSRVAV